VHAKQAAATLPEELSIERGRITTLRSGGASRMRSRRRHWNLQSRAGAQICPASMSRPHISRDLRASVCSTAYLCARYRVLVPDIYKGKLGVTQEEAHHVCAPSL